MDNHHFDEWTKAVTVVASSRRAALRLLAGGAFAAALARLAPEAVAARCGRVGDRCRRKRDCCPGALCEDRKCACPDTSTDCNGRCVSDFMSNPRHCGNCNRRCAEGVNCVDGRCLAPTCPKGTVTSPCSGSTAPTFCSATDFCFCVRRAEGGRRCAANFSCVNDPTCESDADCGGGDRFCGVIEGCCGEATIRRCLSPCANPAP